MFRDPQEQHSPKSHPECSCEFLEMGAGQKRKGGRIGAIWGAPIGCRFVSRTVIFRRVQSREPVIFQWCRSSCETFEPVGRVFESPRARSFLLERLNNRIDIPASCLMKRTTAPGSLRRNGSPPDSAVATKPSSLACA